MATSVRSLTNHYEALRVAPTATTEEIAASFAERMRSVRVRPDISVALLGRLSLAYETLRDPARREAYDRSIGLKAAPAQGIAPGARFAPTQGLEAFARASAVPRPAAKPRASSEPRVAAFIASSLREPIKDAEATIPADPVSVKPTPPAPEPAVARAQPPSSAMPIAASVPRRPAVAAFAQPARRAGLDRTRATLLAGALGVGVLAVALSFPAKKPDSAAVAPPPVAAVTVGLPPAQPARAEPEADVPDIAVAAAEPIVKPRAALATPAPAAEPEKKLDEPVAAAVAPAGAPEQAVADAPVGDPTPAPAAAAAAARMPLPNATIAQTIHKIGYACGTVTSTSAVDGATGVFKITCSSGASYQASPVGGRYHFRRWGNR